MLNDRDRERERPRPHTQSLARSTLALLACVVTAAAHAEPRYRDVKALLLDTLSAPAAIQARLEGELAEAIAKQIGHVGPILVHASVLERFQQGRCGRIETRFITKASTATAPAMTMRVALCSDGRAYRPGAP